MFSYNVFKEASNAEFDNVCKKIENSLNFRKKPPIIDVDGSIVQIYTDGSKNIKVYNNYEVDAVYIDSDIDLSKVFDS